nr:type I polyketide synthase [Mycobacterium canetti]
MGLDWASVFSGYRPKRVELPTYAFQHQKFWLAPAPSVSDPTAAGQIGASDGGAELLASSGFTARLAGRSADEQLAAAIEVVCEHAAAVLGRGDAASVDAAQAFTDSGLNSLSAVELRNRLKAVTGATLSATAVFDYPTPTDLARYLVSHLDGAGRSAAAVVSRARVRTGEPIAVVGMGCRYPGGVVTAEDLWQLVASGRDVISEFPADRGWDVEGLYDADPDALGKCYTRQGGFVDDVANFDARFFGISPGEALAMDPQQRLLLEISWEALENAGIDPLALRGSATGVFVGIYGDGYGVGTAQAQWYADTGHITSVASGRIAYSLGLTGPALSVDTACSSSLVALHLAANSLRAGECDLALAGGSTVLVTPSIFLGFSRQRGLSMDGRCKAFADAADGTGFSEGAGVLVMQRLDDARRAGRRVLAVLAGSAVNQDGASNGLTAPSGPAQQQVIAAALVDAGITGADVDVVEAHGTGTRLGDPIEAQALLATYGQHHKPDAPLWLGSIKSNIGHSQAAAGVAGVIKMIQAMRHQMLPATLHVDRPSSHVDWSSGTVRLLTKAKEWPVVAGRPRRAGVSSFGVSGTNAHVIVEEAFPVESDGVCAGADGSGGGVVAWVVSGKTASALAAQAGRLGRYVRARPALDVVDVGYSLVSTRSVFDHRAVVVGQTRDELLAGLAGVVAGRPEAGVVCGVGKPAGKTAFVFAGQGSQWLGMGSELYAAYPVFAEALDAVVDELDRHLRYRLRDVMWGQDQDLLNTTEFAQPALFAVEVALYRLLLSWGVRPGLVLGHSVGELAAAHIAGALCLPDAAMLVAARGRLMQALPAGGAMFAVQAGEDEVAPMLGHDVSIAAVNGPASVVISGALDAVSVIADRLRGQGRRVHRLAVSHAFHSALMEPMIAEFKAVAAELSVGLPTIPVISNVTGQLVADDFASADYWARHIRAVVRFGDSVRSAHGAGASRFIEVGPGGGLTSLIEASLADAQIVSVPTLRKDRPEPVSVMTAAAQGFVSGMGLDWASVFSGYRPKRVELPTYAFQHQKFWLAPAPSVSDPTAAGQIGASDGGAELLASSGFTARLAGRSADEQLAAAIEVVCEHAAAVLGRDGAAGLDAGQAFVDSGFNSLSAVELRNRLTAVTAVTLPATAIFDHPTPTELAQYLITQIDGHGSSAAAAANPAERIDALTDLFLQACDAGRDADGWKMVALASNTRECMTSPVRNNVSKNVALLADGISDVVVICIPTLTVLSDKREYRDIANAMTGRHSVYSLTLPGFDSSDALPQNADMIVETVSNAIIDVVGASCRFVLSGYSSGGVLAYALSSHLSVKHQRNPLGVALIDTYLPSQIANPSMNEGFSPNDTGNGLSREVIRVARMLNRLTATRLTAAAAYAAIFQAWEPGRSRAPVLNIVAKDRIATVENLREERINRWRTAAAEAAYSVAEVPGDHFGMMSTSSEAIATEIHDWISGLVRGPHP